MTSRDFCYWLQGIFEVADPKQLDERATAQIKAHLAMVFVHEIDPSMGDAEHQAKLDAAHASTPPKKPHPPIGGSGPGDMVYRC